MIGYKLQALTKYLLDGNICGSEQFDSIIESAQLDLSSMSKGNGIIIGYFVYEATLFIERYSQPPALLLAHLSSWLQTYDDERESLNLPSPSIDIENPTTKTADVEINISFSEAIEMIPNDDGEIKFNGINWSIAPAPIDIANEVAVGDSQERETDASYTN